MSEDLEKLIRDIANKYNIPYTFVHNLLYDDIIDEHRMFPIENYLLNLLNKEWFYYLIKKKKENIFQKNQELNQIDTYNYIEYIDILLEFVRKGLSIEEADKNLQEKIEKYSKEHQVSKLISTLVNVYNLTEEGAKIYTSSLENRTTNYFDLESGFNHYLRDGNLNKKMIHGITIVSPTTKGLKKLEVIVNNYFKNRNLKFPRLIEKKAMEKELIVTDYYFKEIQEFYNAIPPAIYSKNYGKIEKEMEEFCQQFVVPFYEEAKEEEDNTMTTNSKYHVFKKIINNVHGFVEISKIAKEEQVDWQIATLMYNEGKEKIDVETAKKIMELAQQYEVSQSILKEIIFDNQVKDDIENIGRFNYEIYIRLTKSKEITDVIGKYNIGKYIETIHELLKKGFSIEEAEEYLQTKIEEYSKKNNISKLASTLMIAYDMTKEGALEVEKMMLSSYDKDETIRKNFLNYQKSSNEFKRKNVRGITIISKTDEGLEYLEKVINIAFENGNKGYISALKNEINSTQLVITDFDYQKTSSYFNGYIGKIYLEHEETIEETVRVFYHETSHFLDYNFANGRYSIVVPKVREIFEKIKDEVNKSAVESITENQKIPEFIRKIIFKNISKTNFGIYNKAINYDEKQLAEEYVTDERLNQKWREEIEEKYKNYSQEDKEQFFRQKLNYERQKYLALIGSLYDIYDGMVKGNLYDNFGVPGHGIEYYTSYHYSDVIEFIALIGEIYNADGKDLLEYELGTELANEMIKLYHEMLGIKYNDNTQNNSEKREMKQEKISALRILKNYISLLQVYQQRNKNNQKNSGEKTK